ncbi:hypothetical protein M135_1806 [Bacteroides fragilis str. S36L5]|nr:hypothetical protein M137_2168 [Bacteroides fragilis str. S36L12]EYA91632.1 hypothetical protein M135_1806 [Bacteroides fragilis str. S36L5]DAR86538.1 MAG TPA: hypothetical protein [Caudoviricetes sp.]
MKRATVNPIPKIAAAKVNIPQLVAAFSKILLYVFLLDAMLFLTYVIAKKQLDIHKDDLIR